MNMTNMNGVGPVPTGRKSREGSMFSNSEYLSASTPITPADSPYTPSSRHPFSPITSSGLATSIPGSSFPHMSTTPLDPPSWLQQNASVGNHQWSGPQSQGWPEVPSHSQQQHQQQQPPQQNGTTANDDIDPALFETLAELLEQNHKAGQAGNNGEKSEFDLLHALQQAISETTVPTQPQPVQPRHPAPIQPGMSQSLLSRRLQQQNIPPSSPQNAYNPFNLNPTVLGTSPLSSSYGTHQPGSLPTSFGAGSFGSVPTPPQSFGASINSRRQSNLQPNPQTPWPLPDRQLGFSETPATTPGGSDTYGSPVGVGPSSYTSTSFPSSAGQCRSNPSIMPMRREAPQHPIPQQNSLAQSFGSAALSSPTHPGSYDPAHTQTPTQPPPIDWSAASNLDMSQLPPLPPGFSVDQFGQGAAGLEMAIRMGMSLAMMNQTGTPQSGSGPGSTPATHPASGSVSLATSPIEPSKRKVPTPPNVNIDALAAELFPQNSFTSAQQDSNSTIDFAQLAASFPNAQSQPQNQGEGPNEHYLISEEAARQDPITAQMWKAYAQANGGLPNGQRMENLTWKMMQLTLKKREEMAAAAAAAAKEEEDKHAALAASSASAAATTALHSDPTSTASSNDGGEQRGRRKGKSRVVGFHKEESPAPE